MAAPATVANIGDCEGLAVATAFVAALPCCCGCSPNCYTPSSWPCCSAAVDLNESVDCRNTATANLGLSIACSLSTNGIS